MKEGGREEGAKRTRALRERARGKEPYNIRNYDTVLFIFPLSPFRVTVRFRGIHSRRRDRRLRNLIKSIHSIRLYPFSSLNSRKPSPLGLPEGQIQVLYRVALNLG